MKIQFTRWCMNPEGRTPVSVEPTRVDIVEHFHPAWITAAGEAMPAAAKMIMKGKQEYVVQGSVEEVTQKLNGE